MDPTKAIESFHSSSGSILHLLIFIGVVGAIIVFVSIFSYKEKSLQFKKFFEKLKPAKTPLNDGKKLFNYMDKHYKGQHFLFFQEESIAQKAIRATKARGNFKVLFHKEHTEEVIQQVGKERVVKEKRD